MIDRQTIDRVMNATNIVDVVQEFVTLRKAGVNLKGHQVLSYHLPNNFVNASHVEKAEMLSILLWSTNN